MRFDEKVQLPEKLEQGVAAVQEPRSSNTGGPVDQQEPETAVEPQAVVESLSPAPEETTVASEEPVLEEAEPPVASRRCQQAGKSILKPSKYTMATKLDKRTEKDPVLDLISMEIYFYAPCSRKSQDTAEEFKGCDDIVLYSAFWLLR